MDLSIPQGSSNFTASGVTVGNNSKFHQGNTYIFNSASDGRSVDGSKSLDEARFEVFFDLLCLDLCLLEQVQQANSRGNTDLFGQGDYDWIVSHLQKKRIPATCFGTPYHGHVSQDQSLRKELSLMSKNEQISYIQALDLVPYYTRLFEHCLANSRRARGRAERVEKATGSVLLEAEFVEKFGNQYALYPKWCYQQVGDAHRVLRLIYENPLRLKKRIQEIAEQHPTWPGLTAMKARMQALQEHFAEVCRELKRTEQPLIGTDSVWWKTPVEQTQDPIATPTASSSKHPNSAGDGAQHDTQTWHMPSNSNVSHLNGPQLNSSVFNGPVHFGNVYGSTQGSEARRQSADPKGRW